MNFVQKAVIKKDDKFLVLLRSSKAKAFPLHWDFPGGKLEPGEEPFAGIEREITEETGLLAKAVETVGSYDFEFDINGEKVPYRFTVFSTETMSGDIKLSSEHLEFLWATREEVLQLKVEPYIKLYFEEHP